VTSLHRRAQANATAALYWLRRVLDDGGSQEIDESIVHDVPAAPGTQPIMHHCLTSNRDSLYHINLSRMVYFLFLYVER